MKIVSSVVKFLSSMKLAIFSLTGLFVLVFVATLAQVDYGIYEAKKMFFEGVFVYATVGGITLPVFLTGYVFGVLLLINLIFVHVNNFKWTAKKIGIWLIHIGLIILIVGSGIVSSYATETQIALEEGESKNYTQSITDAEIAVLKPISESEDEVNSFSGEFLDTGQRLIKGDVELKVIEYYPHSGLQATPENMTAIASQGLGTALMVSPMAPVYSDPSKNMPSAFVEVLHQGQSLGVWLLSQHLAVEQEVMINNLVYRLILRPKRVYLEYQLKLIDFTHDKYLGTDIPKNFASKVQVLDKNNTPIQDALIYMNHPLRYAGKTFYQASFGKQDTMSVLQVVENPGWLLPYISTLIMSLGLLIHFLMMLKRFFGVEK